MLLALRDSWAWSWFPDLNRLDSAPSRWQVLRAAYVPLMRSPTYFVIALVVQLASQIGIVVPLARFARRRGASGGEALVPRYRRRWHKSLAPTFVGF